MPLWFMAFGGTVIGNLVFGWRCRAVQNLSGSSFRIRGRVHGPPNGAVDLATTRTSARHEDDEGKESGEVDQPAGRSVDGKSNRRVEREEEDLLDGAAPSPGSTRRSAHGR